MATKRWKVQKPESDACRKEKEGAVCFGKADTKMVKPVHHDSSSTPKPIQVQPQATAGMFEHCACSTFHTSVLQCS